MLSTGHARGRSFHAGAVDERPDAYRHGFNFQEQWERAIELDPEVVFVTGWNEWVAMQLNKKDGPPVFCDQFNLEFSRDVEMMKGGYGDNYYMQMASNIRRFKGVRPPPPASPHMTIDLSRSFSQWDDVKPTFRDHALETLPRDFRGCGDRHYRVRTGRNDIRVSKVTHDRDNVYFLAQTSEDVTAHSDPNWMWLLIELPGKNAADWEGFHFIANRKPSSSTETSLEVCQGGWKWTSVGTIRYRVEGDRMHIAIPKILLGLQGDDFAIQFKWIDNSTAPGDILDGYVNGDTAPNGRFRYRYEP